MTSLVRGWDFDWTEGLGIKICEPQATKNEAETTDLKEHSHHVGHGVNEFGCFGVNKGCGG